MHRSYTGIWARQSKLIRWLNSNFKLVLPHRSSDYSTYSGLEGSWFLPTINSSERWQSQQERHADQQWGQPWWRKDKRGGRWGREWTDIFLCTLEWFAIINEIYVINAGLWEEDDKIEVEEGKWVSDISNEVIENEGHKDKNYLLFRKTTGEFLVSFQASKECWDWWGEDNDREGVLTLIIPKKHGCEARFKSVQIFWLTERKREGIGFGKVIIQPSAASVIRTQHIIYISWGFV